MKEDLEKEYSKLLQEKTIVNKKHNQKMMLKLKTDEFNKHYCLLTYLPNIAEYVAYATFEIKVERPKQLYLWYIATIRDDVSCKGIGYENMKFLLQFAKQMDCQSFLFRYCPKNQNAVELYKKFPFTKYYDDYDPKMILLLSEVKFSKDENEMTK